MFPSLTPTDRSNVSTGNSVFLCKHFIGEFSRSRTNKLGISDFKNLLSCKSASSVFFSEVVAKFSDIVGLIISVCASEKMPRIYANPVVATMQNVKSVRNSFIMDNPRNTMRGLKNSTNCIISITSFACSASPLPTVFGFLNRLKKSFFHFGNVVLNNLIHRLNFHWNSFLVDPRKLLYTGEYLCIDRSI